VSESPTRSRRIQALALLGGGVAAGVIGAFAIGASAQDTTTGTGSTSTSAPAAPPPGAPHGRGANREVPVTGSKAATLKAAALAKYPGSTVQDVTTETDNSSAAYEVHLTKSDGTHVSVLFDSKLTYVSTETGGPGRFGGPGRGPGGAPGETVVTGSKAATLKAAALAKVSGGTVDVVSTDSGDAAYEVHMTKADGTHVTVKFDKNLKFVGVEDGMGK
jgi:uncharacterized membrane protein YkoI